MPEFIVSSNNFASLMAGKRKHEMIGREENFSTIKAMGKNHALKKAKLRICKEDWPSIEIRTLWEQKRKMDKINEKYRKSTVLVAKA